MRERCLVIVRTMAVATVAAIWAGALHALIIGTRSQLLGQFVWSSRDVVWMAPIGYLIVFGIVALPLSVCAALAPRWITLRAVIFCFAALAAFSVALLFPRIHWLASLALAFGVGYRFAQGANAAWAHAGRRATVMAAAALAATGATMRLTRAASESRAIGSAEASHVDAPNVLYIILDTVRARSLSAYGATHRTSPQLEQLASEGALFEHAFATAPWTLPSHATLVTGRDVAELSASWLVPLDDSTPTLAEVFSEKGYVTGAFVANHFYTGWETGLGRGFARYDDYLVSARQILLSTALLQTGVASRFAAARGWTARFKALASFDWPLHPSFYSDRKEAPMVVGEFLRWQAHLGDRRFMAMLNFYDAHEPYDPPEALARQFGAPNDPQARYEGAIAWMDRELGLLFDDLRRRGVLDNTIVVVTSDHGEQFGEHGLKGHGNSLYLPVLHVPLLIRYPRAVPARTRIDTPVSLRDLPATVLALAGVSSGARIPGVALDGLWHGKTTRPSPILAEVRQEGDRLMNDGPLRRGDMRSAAGDSLHYIRNGDATEELYDFRRDPMEVSELTAGRRGDTAVVTLRGRVEAMPRHASAPARER